MRIFHYFVVANTRDGVVEARGKPANVRRGARRFEALVTKLNGYLDYLKNPVLARRWSSEEEPDDKGGDTPEPEPEPKPVQPE